MLSSFLNGAILCSAASPLVCRAQIMHHESRKQRVWVQRQRETKGRRIGFQVLMKAKQKVNRGTEKGNHGNEEYGYG
jgi:hypothetical protein